MSYLLCCLVTKTSYYKLNCFLLYQIRKTAADQFYITLVTYDDIIDAEVADDVISILSETAWSAGKKTPFLIFDSVKSFVVPHSGMVTLTRCGNRGM